jgi:hypothetical protein
MHIIGGKYEKIPLYRPPNEVFEGFLKILQRLAKDKPNEPITVQLTQLVTMMSTTLRVVISGLSLLNGLGLITTTVLSTSGQVKIQFNPGVTLDGQNIAERIEYIGFRDALQEVFEFREWLMTASVDVIKSAVALEVTAGCSMLREERERHAIHVR